MDQVSWLRVTTEIFRLRSLKGGAVTAVDASSVRSFARHAHEGFGIGLVTAGAQRSWSGRGQVEAIAGDLIVVNPGEVHDGTAAGTSRSWSMLFLSEETVSTVVADLEEGRGGSAELRALVITDARLADLFVLTRRAVLQPDEATAFDERLLLLLAGLLATDPRIGDIPPAGLARARASIVEAPTGPHTLSELAAIAG